MYTPDELYHGSDSFTFQVSDGILSSNTAAATVEIADVLSCGDGNVEGTEQCDDGNQDDTDACLTSCIVATY